MTPDASVNPKPSGRAALPLILVVLLLVWPGSAGAEGESPAPPAPTEAAQTHDLLQDLLREHLADPRVATCLRQIAAPAPAPAPAPEPEPAEAPPPALDGFAAAARMIGAEINSIRDHFGGWADAVGRMPAEFDRARIIFGLEFEGRGVAAIGVLFLVFLGLGIAAELLFHRLTRPWRDRLATVGLDAVGGRVEAVGLRFGLGLGAILAFTIGSVGVFLPVDWPLLLREILLDGLLAQAVLRLAATLARLILAPGAERFRLVPMPEASARFLVWHVVAIVGCLAFGEATISLLGTFGYSPESRSLLDFCLATVVLALVLDAVWRLPRPESALPEAALPDAATAPEGKRRRRGLSLGRPMVALSLLLAWVLWACDVPKPFWLVIFALGLPAAIRLAEQCVDQVLRPPGFAESQAEAATRMLETVLLERGTRFVILGGGALILSHLWGLDPMAFGGGNGLATRLFRGGLEAVVIALLADFAWHVANTLIDLKLAASAGHATGEEVSAGGARIRTLLPIVRNLLLVVLLVVTGMMILAALGFEIGPLLASAGVIGVAIGFGAQTLVRDIISGIFYLIDDAFRVGEYIQSGSYKGTVESFSLRSIKLRHHRGPLFTVPFGVLGAVQNMSRDWVIEKMTIGVEYDTDLTLLRKIIKSIGAELMADPEFGRHILSPLKLQGIENFGDYAMQIRMKLTTKPGDVQFQARRRALALIKAAFDANGIRFARPTIQVSREEEPARDDDMTADELAVAAHIVSQGSAAGAPASRSASGSSEPIRRK